MFVNFKKIAVTSTIVALALIPVTASADTVKTTKSEAVLINNTITYGIDEKNQKPYKGRKYFFGQSVKYTGPTQAFFINGIN